MKKKILFLLLWFTYIFGSPVSAELRFEKVFHAKNHGKLRIENGQTDYSNALQKTFKETKLNLTWLLRQTQFHLAYS